MRGFLCTMGSRAKPEFRKSMRGLRAWTRFRAAPAPQHFNLAEDQPEAKLPLGCSGAGGLRTCRVPEVQEKEGLSQR